MRNDDLAVLVAVSKIATAVWVAKGGAAWIAAHYPPASGFYVDKEGVR
jgi:hypothetical protein